MTEAQLWVGLLSGMAGLCLMTVGAVAGDLLRDRAQIDREDQGR